MPEVKVKSLETFDSKTNKENQMSTIPILPGITSKMVDTPD